MKHPRAIVLQLLRLQLDKTGHCLKRKMLYCERLALNDRYTLRYFSRKITITGLVFPLDCSYIKHNKDRTPSNVVTANNKLYWLSISLLVERWGRKTLSETAPIWWKRLRWKTPPAVTSMARLPPGQINMQN